MLSRQRDQKHLFCLCNSSQTKYQPKIKEFKMRLNENTHSYPFYLCFTYTEVICQDKLALTCFWDRGQETMANGNHGLRTQINATILHSKSKPFVKYILYLLFQDHKLLHGQCQWIETYRPVARSRACGARSRTLCRARPPSPRSATKCEVQ